MDQAVKEIVDAIVRFERPKKVILFGSRSHDGAAEGSDVDLAVLFAGLKENPVVAALNLRIRLFDITTLPVDLLVYDISDFELRARHVSSFESVIAREGVLAYG